MSTSPSPSRSAPTAAPALLDPSGRTTPATTFLLIHHGLRRDLARFLRLAASDVPVPDPDLLRTTWTSYRAVLDAHHAMEDTRLFPALVEAFPQLAPHVAALDDEHAQLDARLDAVEAAVAGSLAPGERDGLVDALTALADLVEPHLTAEEEHLVPRMLAADAPPVTPRPNGGFDAASTVPWVADGVAAHVVEVLLAELPPDARAAAPGWLAEAATRRTATWGAGLVPGSATTARPHRDGEGWPSPSPSPTQRPAATR